MPGVEVVECNAFSSCDALTDVECGNLELIVEHAFDSCLSLRSIDLPSAEIAYPGAFFCCGALTNVKFGVKLESIRDGAFLDCTSLERITIPLKDGMIDAADVFFSCESLKYVDLVEGALLHQTIAALQMEEWKNDVNEDIVSINQILSTTPAGNAALGVVGGKTEAIQTWIRSVLHKKFQYKAEHRRILNEAATTLQLALPNDIVFKNVLPFLELPPYTFQGED